VGELEWPQRQRSKEVGHGGRAGVGLRKKSGSIDGFVPGDGSEEARQGADAEGWMVGDTNALVTGLIRLKDEVAAGLMDQLVSVVFAEVLGENPAGEVAGKLQLPDITSSRTRWRRILLFAFSG
jgi:hypothetical protein